MQSLRRVVSDHQLVVHCAGPFERLPLEPLDAAIDCGIDYIDISENRRFHQEVMDRQQAIAGAGIAVMSGFSVVPVMAAMFAEMVKGELARIDTIRTYASPDTRHHRGRAMFETMLYGAGRDFEFNNGEHLEASFGWSHPEWIEFPPPVGRRLVYRVFGMADQDVLPAVVGANSVEFKAGCEFAFLNRCLSGLTRVSRAIPVVSLVRLHGFVRGLAWLAGRFGRSGGAAMFEFGNQAASDHRRVAVVSRDRGEVIPIVVAAIAADMWCRGQVPVNGIVGPTDWINLGEFLKQLETRDLKILAQAQGQSTTFQVTSDS